MDKENSKQVGDFLAHYGVLGMKWGVRRARSAQVKGGLLSRKKKQYERHAEINKPYQDKKKAAKTATAKAIRTGASAYKKGMSDKLSRKTSDTKKQLDVVKKVVPKKKQKLDIKKMSDSDLKTLTNRLQLEKQYKDLTKGQKTQGAKFVGDILKNSAKQTATTFVSQAMTDTIKAALKKDK